MKLHNISQFGFDKRVAVEHGHGIDANHALYAVLALLCLVRCLLGPDEREA